MAKLTRVVLPAPHVEDLVLLPSPVLRLLNLIDDNQLHNEDEYEGRPGENHSEYGLVLVLIFKGDGTSCFENLPLLTSRVGVST